MGILNIHGLNDTADMLIVYSAVHYQSLAYIFIS